MNATNPNAAIEPSSSDEPTIEVETKPLVKKKSVITAGFGAWVMLFFLVLIKLCN